MSTVAAFGSDRSGSSAKQVRQNPEPVFVSSTRLPTLPEVAEQTPSQEWRSRLHRFHFGGQAAAEASAAASPRLEPAGLADMVRPERLWQVWPIFVPEAGSGKGEDADSRKAVRFSTLLKEAFERLEADGAKAEIAEAYIPRLNRCFGRVVEAGRGAAQFRDAVEGALHFFLDDFDLSPSGRKQLEEELQRLGAQLPSAGMLFTMNASSFLRLYHRELGEARAASRSDFVAEVRRLATRLDEILAIDSAHNANGKAAGSSASLGAASSLIDLSALSKTLPTYRGAKPLPPERRTRIENALSTLKGYLEKSQTEAGTVLFHTGAFPEGLSLPDTDVLEQDGLAAAAGMFDKLAAEMVEVLKAVRLARLEATGSYDPATHDEGLERFTWESCTETELQLIPSVVVLEPTEKLQAEGLGAFSALLRSGRPVHVLGLTDPSYFAAGYHAGLGYMAMAHREAFVLQSSLARPEHLLEGLGRMAGALRPGAALVALPTWEGQTWAGVQLDCAVESRRTPCFTYDPDSGSSWADRFDLAENPSIETDWSVKSFTYKNSSGEEGTLESPFTGVHFAALDPKLRSHFMVLPSDAWDDEQVELADFLTAAESGSPRAIPYIWVVLDNGTLARAVVTRELAFATLDRLRSWRILQELAGTNNVYARRAAEKAREEALAEAAEERQKLEAEHAEEIEAVRSSAAGEAMDRLVNVLLNMDYVPAAAPSGASAPAAPVAAPAEVEVAAEPAAAEEPEEDEVSFDEPYIDTVLCTTCNECTTRNPVMFKYDGNKQAYIADAKGGTFAQLVAAAKKCPARCIHPGVPRSDDATATPELVAEAAQFN